MSAKLVALMLADASLLCPTCAEAEHRDHDYPDSATTVYESDEWRTNVVGTCKMCGTLIDGGKP